MLMLLMKRRPASSLARIWASSYGSWSTCEEAEASPIPIERCPPPRSPE